MYTPLTLTRGKRFGYGNRPLLISHNGEAQGFMVYIGRFFSDKLTVIVLTNLTNYNINNLGGDIAAIYDPALAEPIL